MLRYLIFLLPVLFFVIVFTFLISSFTKTNVLETDYVYPGVGWKNNTSVYSGSELSFAFHNSSAISFKFYTESQADQDIEIFVNDTKYIMSSPNLNDQELKIELDQNKPYTVTIRHTCSQIEHLCHISAQGIYVDRSAKLTNYQRHSKVLSVLGDSISTIYGRNNFTQVLSDKLGYELHNASINGATISNISSNDRLAVNYDKDLKDYYSDVVIIYLGSNDAAASINTEKFKNDYLNLVSAIKKGSPEAEIILVGPLFRNDVDSFLLDHYINIVSEIAEEKDLIFVNTKDWLKDYEYADGVHPTLESQQKLVSNFEEILGPILK